MRNLAPSLLLLLACVDDPKDTTDDTDPGATGVTDSDTTPTGSDTDDTDDTDGTDTTGGTDGGGDSGTDEDSPLVLAPPSPCESPAAEPSWVEVGQELGFVGMAQSKGQQGDGGAIALDDFDLDGDLDLFMGWAEEPSVLYLRDGDSWTPQVLEGLSRVTTVNLADVDGDGRRDLLTGRHGPAAIYKVGGDGEVEFTEIPIPDWELISNIQEFAPADIDGDGDVDLYALVRGGGDDLSQKRDAVLWNNGEGVFELDLDAVPEAVNFRHGFDAGWFDWDLDGDLDIYVANDLGNDYGSDALLENRDGVLVDASEACTCDVTHAGMSIDFADFSGDGHPDLYVADSFVNSLFQSLGNGSYVDAALSLNAGLPDENVYMTWGAIFVDWDNDSDLDIVASRGDFSVIEATDVSTPTVLSWTGVAFEDISPELGLEAYPGIFRSVLAVDLNGDGLVDPIYTQARDRPMVFMSQGCTAGSWLKIEGPEGARVEVQLGDEVKVDWITSQSGLAATHAPMLHMGLGEHESVDSIRMITPDGTEHVRSKPFEARRRVTLTLKP